jgi:hypothetical protein
MPGEVYALAIGVLAIFVLLALFGRGGKSKR